jgi:hypothetical protein
VLSAECRVGDDLAIQVLSPQSSETEKEHGKDFKDRSSEPETEIQSAWVQSLQTLWASAGISAEIQRLPNLFPPAGIAGRYSGCNEIKLVKERKIPVELKR